MLAAKATTPSARLAVGDARPLGAAVSRFWTAAGVSYGLAGGVKDARAKSKLGKIEAATVEWSSAKRICISDFTHRAPRTHIRGAAHGECKQDSNADR
eukprot:2664413-Prymnesium_polylepis.1